MEEESPELEELATLEDAMKKNDIESMFQNSDSAESVESSYSNVPELKKGPLVLNKVELERTIEKEFSELGDNIVRETIDLEEALLKRKAAEALDKLEERNSIARRNSSNEDEDRQAEIQIPLMVEESASIDLRDGSVSSKVHQVKINTNKKSSLKNIFKSQSKVERSASQSSVFQQIKNAKKCSKSEFGCCKKTILIIVSFIAYVAVLSIVSIAMIVIGSMHLDDCPIQPYIPIYLVVGGAFGILFNFTVNSRKIFCSKSSYCSYFYGIINLFLLIWFILGCVWVYGVSHVEYNDTSDKEYCHRTVYLFAFWLLNLVFILLGASLALYCCAALCCVLDR